MSYKISRKIINEMVKREQNISSRRSSGGSGAGGGGGVSSAWVDEHYVSKDFFARLFTIHSDVVTQEDPHGEVVEPNDLETDIDNIELMFGSWTEHYLSALDQGSGGGGGGGALLTEPLASINEAGMGTPSGANKVIVWNGSTWTYMPYTTGSGTVTSVTMTVPTGFKVSNGDTQTINSSGTFALTFGGTITKNQVLASPAAANGTPAWRALVAEDIPDLSSTYAAASYFDASGHAKSALKLTTISKKAWGQTYWTSDGVPDTISGTLSDVGDIEMGNGNKIKWKNSSSTLLSFITLSSSNEFVLGESTAAQGYTTYLRGREIIFQSGYTNGSAVNNASLDTNGLFAVKKLKIGSIVISEDTTNGGLHIESAGIYADTYVSSLGAGSGGGSGSGITMNDVWTAMAMSAPNESSQQIHVSHLAQALSNYAQKTWVSSNMVTIDTSQAISGQKTFTGGIIMASNLVPSTDNQYSIGTEQKRINGVFVNGQVYVSGMTIHYQSGSGIIGGYYLSAGSTNIILETNGNVWQRTTSQYYSDMRLKDVISDVDLSVEQIAGAPVFNFKWKDDEGDMQVGSSAQYWHKHLKPVTAIASNGQYGMDYGRAALISSVIVARKVMTHEKRIAALEKENKELKDKLETLKAS